jgi:hypothetical protein
MKQTILLAVTALFIGSITNAQSTADSIAAKYKLQPMPEQMGIDKKFPVLGTYQLTSSDSTSGNLTITLDSFNKGMVWVEGLPQGRFKAFLKKSPSTYRITAQKTNSGKQIPEGTLYYNAEANTLNVSLGAAYNDTDPTAIFASNTGMAGTDNTAEVKTEVKTKTSAGKTKTKTKEKVTYYTATKLDVASTTQMNQ